MANTYYVTFGQRYGTEPHPVLSEDGKVLKSLPDSWVEIEAESYEAAHQKAIHLFGPAWAMLYDAEQFDNDKTKSMYSAGAMRYSEESKRYVYV